jgi:hypothetical protein
VQDTGGLLYVLAEIGKSVRDSTLAGIVGTGEHSPLLGATFSVEPLQPAPRSVSEETSRSAVPRDVVSRPPERSIGASLDSGLGHRVVDATLPLSTTSASSGKEGIATTHPVSHLGKVLIDAATYLSKFEDLSGNESELGAEQLRFGDLIVLQSHHVSNGCLFVQSQSPTKGKVFCHSSGVGVPQEVFRLVPALVNRRVGDVIRQGDVVHIRTYEWNQHLAPSEASVDKRGLPAECTSEAVRVEANLSMGLNTAFVVYCPDSLPLLQARPPSPILSSQRLTFLGHAADATSDRSTAIRSIILRRFALQAFSTTSGRTTVALDILHHGALGRDGATSEVKGSSQASLWGFRPVSKYARSSVGPALFVHAVIPSWANASLPCPTSYAAPKSDSSTAAVVPLHVQEAAIVDSVLKALLGHGSEYAYADVNGHFSVPHSVSIGTHAIAIDPSTRLLANQLLPLASLYADCAKMCQALRSPGAGLVAQAFGAAARQILKEYVTLLVQVEAAARTGAKYCDSKGYLVRNEATVSSRPGNTPQTAGFPAIIWSMSLQRLWFYLQPSLLTLQALSTLLRACKGRRGGALVSVLAHEVVGCGEEVAQTLASFLLEQAITPYFEILDKWIYQGVVHDLFDEFMITEDVTVTADGLKHDITNRYWDERFRLRPEMAPSFLLPLQDLILTAGKYVHVLRLCSFVTPHHALSATHAGTPQASFVPATPIGSGTKAVPVRESESFGFQDESIPNSSRVIRRVAQYLSRTVFLGLEPDAYALKLFHAAASASRSLLNHFVQAKSLGGLALFSRLNSLKSFFFSAHGDFLTHFLDNSEKELAKELASPTKGGNVAVAPGSLASINRLRTLFDISFRNTTLENDPHRGEFTCALAPSSLLAHLEMLKGGEVPGTKMSSSGLKGYNSFTLDFVVDWPLSIIVTRNCVAKYQLLFRNIIFAKYVEKAVCACWVAHQSCKELGVRVTMASSYALRQRMLHFLQNLIYYMLAEVIEPRWHEMLVTMRSSTTVEEIIRSHEKCLDLCLEDCLLASHELMKLQTKLITLCLLFSQQITQSVESHRLTEQELDERAGLNRASKRARAALEKGDYYTGDDDEDASSISSRVTAASRRRSSAAAERADPVIKDRTRRQARINVQTEAMQHTMAQHGWQAMIVKSSRMFDTLLREFLAALLDKTRGEFQSHLLHLCERLDFNGFYTQHLQLVGLSDTT